MRRVQLVVCFFGISAVFFISNVQARSSKRLEGEEIQGGNDATIGQIPYQVSVQVNNKNLCGGSILAERFIITAAHCVTEDDGQFSNYSLKVVAGTNNLNVVSINKVVADVVEVFVPTEFDPRLLEYNLRTTGDIAILRLNKDLGLEGNPNLGKVKLPEKDETYDGFSATISGFGYNKVDVVIDPITSVRHEINIEKSGKMRYAKANIVSYEECLKIYDVIKVTKSHICAATVQRVKDQPEGLCGGDSGGPLVYNGIQIGVVSHSPVGCREDYKPAVFTRVSKYVEFINKVVRGETDNYSIRSNTLSILA